MRNALNISYLDKNNNWLVDVNDSLIENKIKVSSSRLAKEYFNESKINAIFSETTKIKLEKSIFNQKKLSYISSTSLNKFKLYDGITNLYILTNSKLNIINSIKIRVCFDKKLLEYIYDKISCDL